MKKKLIKRLFGGLLNLFKLSENPLLKAPDYSGQKIPPRGNYTKMGPLEPDKVVAPLYYGPYNLPGVTVTAPNLKKALPFPYGQINVEKENGKTLAYPSGNNPLQEAVFRNKAKRQIAGNRGLLFLNGGSFNGLPLSFILQFQLNQTNPLTGKKPEVKGWEINDGQFDVLTAQEGDKLNFGGSNKSNRFLPRPVLNIPETNVNGIDRRWRFDRRQQDHGNGHKVISDTFFDYYDGGDRYLGDLAPIRGGRTIYTSPKGNDTLYWNKPNDWIWYLDGLMPVGGNLPGAKANFFKNLKRPLIKNLQGGHIERTDNTRVASGRPQQVLNKIPYGAGKGPAGEGPMRLFNDPYINMGLMAMAPMAVKIQSRNALAPTQSIESLPVSTNQSYGLLRLYRAAQQKGYKGTVEDFIALSSEILGTPQAMGPEGNKFLGYNLERGNNVLYSRPNPENPKVEGLTVNEPARWQELLKKIIK